MIKRKKRNKFRDRDYDMHPGKKRKIERLVSKEFDIDDEGEIIKHDDMEYFIDLIIERGGFTSSGDAYEGQMREYILYLYINKLEENGYERNRYGEYEKEEEYY